MTPKEFKAWFDGFTEAMDDKPTAKQWARVKERVAEIDGKTVTEKVYVDRYLPSYPYYERWRNYGPVWASCSAGNTNGNAVTMATSTASLKAATFEPLSAMASLGRADAAMLAGGQDSGSCGKR